MTRVRPRVFVGSSREGLTIAQHLQLGLDHDCEVEPWTDGVFGLSQGSLEGLVTKIPSFDFAVMVLTADDMVTSRDSQAASPRDNVLFELGLFMGALGRDRTFMVHDRQHPPRLPSDLRGVTAATFEPHASGNWTAALGAACTIVRTQVARLGLRAENRMVQLSSVADNVSGTSDKMKEMIRLMARSRKVELDIIATMYARQIEPAMLVQIQADRRALDELLTTAD